VTATRTLKSGLLAVALATLAACAHAPLPAGNNDPFEAANRAWFEKNLALDGLVSGAPDGSDTPETTTEAPVDADIVATTEARRPSRFRQIVSNFGANLGIPSSIVNDLLQVRPHHAAENSLRLVINSTIGLGGLFDPAGAMGVHGRSSDFGETLHRWGVGEGAYVVLPVLGPSTQRDTVGLVVDLAIDPLRFVLPTTEFRASIAARLAGRFADRAEYADILDANVINTADPYAQARLLYLQTRRYHLGIENEQEVIDPYADLYD